MKLTDPVPIEVGLLHLRFQYAMRLNHHADRFAWASFALMVLWIFTDWRAAWCAGIGLVAAAFGMTLQCTWIMRKVNRRMQEILKEIER